jgi:cardiolipin synthase A/B
MLSVNAKQANQYTLQNRLKLISGGREYFDLLLELIAAATESIHLQTYINYLPILLPV